MDLELPLLTESERSCTEMVCPHGHQAAQKSHALAVSLIGDPQAENAGVNDSQVGIRDGSC